MREKSKVLKSKVQSQKSPADEEGAYKCVY